MDTALTDNRDGHQQNEMPNRRRYFLLLKISERGLSLVGVSTDRSVDSGDLMRHRRLSRHHKTKEKR